MSNPVPTAANENPGAQAGATGAKWSDLVFVSEADRDRADAAINLVFAIKACDPNDARQLIEAALADFAMGMPLPPLLSAMDDARWWASLVPVYELKAYALACFEAMHPDVRSAFLAYAAGVKST